MQYQQLIDFHIHTKHSCDGHDSLMMIGEHAVTNGLQAVAVTDHAECQRYWRDGFDGDVRRSFFDAEKAKQAFQGRLTVIAGIELGQPLHNLQAAADALGANPLDFVIASLHCIKGRPDFWEIDYKTEDVKALLTAYFQEVYEMVCWGQFDSLGHLTYPLRYIVGREKISVDLNEYREMIHAILLKLVQQEKALELNTQGYRTDYGRPVPDLEIIRLFKQLGGKYITIGSDAHYAKDCGANIAEGMALLEAAGFTKVTIYKHRQPILLPIQ